jgi:hypothetical protein
MSCFCFVLPGVTPPTTDCLRIGPTTGRLARSSDLRSLLRTVLVWPEIRTFVKPVVLRAVSSAVIIRFRRWVRLNCLSWRCDVTRGLPFRGLSFVLPVCRRRIYSGKSIFHSHNRVCDDRIRHLNHPRSSLIVLSTKVKNLPFWKLEFSQVRHATAPLKWPWASGGYGSDWKDTPGHFNVSRITILRLINSSSTNR